jgi:hypothetical protein
LRRGVARTLSLAFEFARALTSLKSGNAGPISSITRVTFDSKGFHQNFLNIYQE